MRGTLEVCPAKYSMPYVNLCALTRYIDVKIIDLLPPYKQLPTAGANCLAVGPRSAEQGLEDVDLKFCVKKRQDPSSKPILDQDLKVQQNMNKHEPT